MKYKVYNGTEWVDICNCDYNIRDTDNTWKLVNPKEDEIYVKTESGWSLITCDNTCVRNEALGCSTMGNYVSIGKSIEFTNCSSIVGGSGCSKIVAYIPFTLTPNEIGINFIFSSGDNRSYSVWDGLDITDICQTEVLGGLGFFGTGQNLTTMVVNPGTYIYDRLIYFDPSLNLGNGGWKDISNEVDSLEITVPTEVYKPTGSYTNESLDSTGTTETVLNTTGYSSTVVPYGNPNEVFLTTDKDNVNESDDHARVFSFIRKPAPPEGYPNEETFLIRVFGHPTETSTKFFIENKLECINKYPILLNNFCISKDVAPAGDFYSFSWTVDLQGNKNMLLLSWELKFEYNEECSNTPPGTNNITVIIQSSIGTDIDVLSLPPDWELDSLSDDLNSGTISKNLSIGDLCSGTSHTIKATLKLNYSNLIGETFEETYVIQKSNIANNISHCY